VTEPGQSFSATDLLRLSELLPATDKRLRQLISDTHALHSAHSDLKLATDFAARLITLQTTSQLPREFTEDCCLALMCSAIVFYARATKSDSDHRKTFDLRRLMDEHERENHDLICRLRDDAMAHYGPGEIGSVTVREDRLFVSAADNKVLCTTRNIAGSETLAHVIRQQSQRSLLLMQRLFEQKQLELIDALNRAAECDGFLVTWDDARVDLREALGTTMAEKILSGPRVGTRRLSGEIKGNSKAMSKGHLESAANTPRNGS
jgi:hypothetical protein